MRQCEHVRPEALMGLEAEEHDPQQIADRDAGHRREQARQERSAPAPCQLRPRHRDHHERGDGVDEPERPRGVAQREQAQGGIANGNPIALRISNCGLNVRMRPVMAADGAVPEDIRTARTSTRSLRPRPDLPERGPSRGCARRELESRHPHPHAVRPGQQAGGHGHRDSPRLTVPCRVRELHSGRFDKIGHMTYFCVHD